MTRKFQRRRGVTRETTGRETNLDGCKQLSIQRSYSWAYARQPDFLGSGSNSATRCVASDLEPSESRNRKRGNEKGTDKSLRKENQQQWRLSFLDPCRVWFYLHGSHQLGFPEIDGEPKGQRPLGPFPLSPFSPFFFFRRL